MWTLFEPPPFTVRFMMSLHPFIVKSPSPTLSSTMIFALLMFSRTAPGFVTVRIFPPRSAFLSVKSFLLMKASSAMACPLRSRVPSDAEIFSVRVFGSGLSSSPPPKLQEADMRSAVDIRATKIRLKVFLVFIINLLSDMDDFQ